MRRSEYVCKCVWETNRSIEDEWKEIFILQELVLFPKKKQNISTDELQGFNTVWNWFIFWKLEFLIYSWLNNSTLGWTASWWLLI